MNRRRSALVAAVAVTLSAFSFIGGTTPVAQANYCPPGTPIPPSVPPAPQVPPSPQVPTIPAPQGNDIFLYIIPAYNHIGGTQLDSLGCVNGQMAHDTRYIPPRAEYVLIAVAVKCTPGQVFGGGRLSGLGVNTTTATVTCGPPHPVTGYTAATSGLYYIRTNLAGSITATWTIKGRALTSTARTLLPVSQPV